MGSRMKRAAPEKILPVFAYGTNGEVADDVVG